MTENAGTDTLTLYRYGCLERPPAPGAIPRDGMYRCASTECYDNVGRRCWGWVEYTRPLKQFEEMHFSLSYIRKTLTRKAY